MLEEGVGGIIFLFFYFFIFLFFWRRGWEGLFFNFFIFVFFWWRVWERFFFFWMRTWDGLLFYFCICLFLRKSNKKIIKLKNNLFKKREIIYLVSVLEYYIYSYIIISVIFI